MDSNWRTLMKSTNKTTTPYTAVKSRGRWGGQKPVTEAHSSQIFQSRKSPVQKPSFQSKWGGMKPVNEEPNHQRRSPTPNPVFQSKWGGMKPVADLGETRDRRTENSLAPELRSKYGSSLKKDFRPTTLAQSSSGKWGPTIPSQKQAKYKIVEKKKPDNTHQCRPTTQQLATMCDSSWDMPVDGYLCFEAYARDNWGYDTKTFNKMIPPSTHAPSLFQTIYSKYSNISKMTEANNIFKFLVRTADIPLDSIDLGYLVFRLENCDTHTFTQKYTLNKYFDMEKPAILKELKKNKEQLEKIKKLKLSKAKLNKEQLLKITRECVHSLKIRQIKYYLNTYLDEEQK